MGHFLDPLLDQVKAKYSDDVHEAHQSGLFEGIDEAIFLIKQFRDTKVGYDGDTGTAWCNKIIAHLDTSR